MESPRAQGRRAFVSTWPVTTTDWRVFLESWSKELIAADADPGFPAEVVASGWLGFPGATEKKLTALEERLDVQLPPSYREFLAVSNGWRKTGRSIWRIWSTEEVDWFRVRNAFWIDAYVNPHGGLGDSSLTDEEYLVYGEAQDSVRFRVEYLETALEISDTGDSAIYLLNPKVVTRDGEWEAWFFANWLPGAIRYRSFAELMEAEYRSFQARDTT